MKRVVIPQEGYQVSGGLSTPGHLISLPYLIFYEPIFSWMSSVRLWMIS